MITRADLHPLFDPSVSLSADQARAIVGALQDIAESDGLHAEEQALIAELVADYNLDLGDQATVAKVSRRSWRAPSWIRRCASSRCRRA